ncbi:EAL domain-containing protein [Salinimonas sp. HHU 13199]|uniref:EAL domain-containing protein n=1 Tax=Salinimonas profundi TaxID=2729140 RepID=A0ABR8LKG6_9ALTE|nr:EAL domain-containing protein [Salinimonas profundi]MBD3586252.1 EAL domain-containing protein [Salinimonas profundi]
MSAKVLVLDDDKIIRLSLFHALTKEGFACSACASIVELIKASRALNPDVILVDLCLGAEDGLDAFSALAEHNSAAKIIVISGADMDVIDAACQAASAQGLDVAGMLKKPFALKSLVQLIREATSADARRVCGQTNTDRSVTDGDLHQAILNRELSLEFQPKLDIHTQSLAGAEVLCRWHSEKFGTIAPDVFIPMAERSNSIIALTEYVLISAIQWLSEFLKIKSRYPAGLVSQDFHLSINISGLSLNDTNFLNKLDTLIGDYRVQPSHLMLEMSESVAIGQHAVAPEILTRLRLRGYRLAVDDIGSGLASIEQLVRLPFSELKIHRRFVTTTTSAYESSLITSTLVKLGQGLGLNVTAVGVEDADTVAMLEQIDCQFAQGFHFAPALTPDAFSQWLTKHASEQLPYRIATLRAMKPHPSQPEDRFDRLVRLISRIFNMPVCGIAVLEETHCYLKAKIGLNAETMPVGSALCYRLLPDTDSIIIPDLLRDEHAAGTSLVNARPPYRLFVSHAVRANNGCILGSVFAADRTPGNWTDKQESTLKMIVRVVEKEFHYNAAASLDAVSQISHNDAFTRRADALVHIAAGAEHAVHVVKITALSYQVTVDDVIQRISKMARSILFDADDLGRTGETQVTALFIGRRKDEVIKLLVKAELELKDIEQQSPMIDSLRITHYSPDAMFGDSLQHIFCQPEKARSSHIIIRS